MGYCAKHAYSYAQFCVHCAAANRVPAKPAGVPFQGLETAYDPKPTPKATETMVGGQHYLKCKIQPMRYAMVNGFDALQFTVLKYITRFRDKNGIEDLKKARHAIDMLIEHEEKELNAHK